MNALRLREGFEPALFEARTGLAWTSIEARMGRLEARGLVERSATRCRPSRRGMDFLNELLLDFLPESPAGAAS